MFHDDVRDRSVVRMKKMMLMKLTRVNIKDIFFYVPPNVPPNHRLVLFYVFWC